MHPIIFEEVEHYTLFELLPAVTHSQRDMLKEEDLVDAENRIDVSLTVKYGITSDLILDGTVNPDFSPSGAFLQSVLLLADVIQSVLPGDWTKWERARRADPGAMAVRVSSLALDKAVVEPGRVAFGVECPPIYREDALMQTVRTKRVIDVEDLLERLPRGWKRRAALAD